MKRLLFILMMALVCLNGYSQVYKGDMNNDDMVNTGDLTKVINVIMGTDSLEKIAKDTIQVIKHDTVIVYEPHEWIDLGLPSGTLWATCNVGASKPEEYGDYFMFGDTTPKDTCDWTTYKQMTPGQASWEYVNKYTVADGQTSASWYTNGVFTGDNKTRLDPEDDAATANWGSNWCMPTRDQLTELINSDYTTTTWTTRNGVKGRLITSKTNGKSLFLPAAGCRFLGTVYDTGTYGYFWSSEIRSDYTVEAWELCSYSDAVFTGSTTRRLGRSVRAVRK